MEQTMTKEKKLALLEDMLEMDAGELKAETVLTDLDNWDSMAKLSLIVLLDEECGKTITSDEIKKLASVQDILDYMG